jgi:hypothetical protein
MYKEEESGLRLAYPRYESAMLFRTEAIVIPIKMKMAASFNSPPHMRRV